MADFISFDSFDDMMGYLAKSDQIARDQITPEQREMLENDFEDLYWVRLDFQVPIYGRCWSAGRGAESSLRLCETREEAQQEIDHLRAKRDAGYLFGEAYSAWCPEGELGSTHVICVQRISKEMFDLARENNWGAG